MTAWITLWKKFLTNRRFIRASSFLSLLTFDSLVSFITEVSSLNSLSSFFSCSLSRFLTQSSVLLVESSSPRVFSLVSHLQSTWCRRDGGVSLGIYLSTSVIVSSFAPFLGFIGCRIGCFLIIELSEVSSFIFARNTQNIWRYNC